MVANLPLLRWYCWWWRWWLFTATFPILYCKFLYCVFQIPLLRMLLFCIVEFPIIYCEFLYSVFRISLLCVEYFLYLLRYFPFFIVNFPNMYYIFPYYIFVCFPIWLLEIACQDVSYCLCLKFLKQKEHPLVFMIWFTGKRMTAYLMSYSIINCSKFPTNYYFFYKILSTFSSLSFFSNSFFL